MNRSVDANSADPLSAMIDALVRRFGSTGAGETTVAEETWLGWDAWVRVGGDAHDPGHR